MEENGNEYSDGEAAEYIWDQARNRSQEDEHIISFDDFAPPEIVAAVHDTQTAADPLPSPSFTESTSVENEVIQTQDRPVSLPVQKETRSRQRVNELRKETSPEQQNSQVCLAQEPNPQVEVASKPDAQSYITPNVAKKTASNHQCTVCDRYCSNRYIMARHLLTRMHHNRALKRPQQSLEMLEEYHDLVLRLSPFQCQICQFYCHSNKDLLSHLMASDHQKACEDLLGPQFCVLCRYTTEEGEELIEHAKTEEHETMVLSQSEHRPCVIREKRTAINCPQCDAVVASSKRLQSHRETAHGPRKRGPKVRVNRVCGYCEKKFCSQKAMAIHVRRRHTKERPYECTECDRTFTDKYSLADHEKTKTHLRNMNASQRGLPKQARRSTKRKAGHKCEHCDYVAADYAALRPHYLTNHASVDVNCDLCGLDFVSSSALANHKKSRRHLSLEEAERVNGSLVSCDLCSQKFADETKMSLHRITHQKRVTRDSNEHQYAEFLRSIPPNTKKVSCPVCNAELGRQNIAAHLRRHEQVFPYSCSICDKRFASSNSMRMHLKEHAGLVVKKCKHCDAVFTSRSSYNSHIAKHTVPEEMYVRCRFCAKTFTHQWKLNRHYRLKHDDNPLHCSHPGCNMSFSQQCDFTRHARTHTMERSSLCDMCSYKGSTKLALQRHHLVHTNERSYKCEHCPYKAKHYSHLRRHIRIHIGCKPFKCPYCEYACNTIENVRKHIKTTRKHAGKPVYCCPIEECDFGDDSAKAFRSHLQSHPGYEKVNVTSIFTGIYAKEEDTTVPEEGAQVLPSRERHVSRRKQRKTRNDVQEWVEAEEIVEMQPGETDLIGEEIVGNDNAMNDLGQNFIEVEIINPDGDEIELTSDHISLLVQQALMNHQTEEQNAAQHVQFVLPSDGFTVTTE